jgi:hypothetical protein
MAAIPLRGIAEQEAALRQLFDRIDREAAALGISQEENQRYKADVLRRLQASVARDLENYILNGNSQPGDAEPGGLIPQDRARPVR